MRLLVHVTTREAWERARDSGVFGSQEVEREGFLHASWPHQVVEVANRLFRGRRGLVLLVIDAGRVSAPVVVENTEGGSELYPHVYGPLNVDAVREVLPFPPREDGTFELPPELRS